MFYVGQKVVCVNARFERLGLRSEITPLEGRVYTIRAIDPSRGGPSVACLLLNEIINAPREYADGFRECAFRATRFRPVVNTNIEVFQRMLAPAPKQTEPV
jgi:hypothetical protein